MKEICLSNTLMKTILDKKHINLIILIMMLCFFTGCTAQTPDKTADATNDSTKSDYFLPGEEEKQKEQDHIALCVLQTEPATQSADMSDLTNTSRKEIGISRSPFFRRNKLW